METFYRAVLDQINIMHNAFAVDERVTKLHYHPSYELFVMLEGRTRLLLDGRMLTVLAGDVVLIRPDTLHKNMGTSRHTRCAIHVTPHYLLRYLSQPLLDSIDAVFRNNRLTLRPDAFQEALALIRSMEEQQDSPFGPVHFAALAALLANPGKLEPERPMYANAAVNGALSYIDRNFAEIEGLDDIADALHITKPYLCQIFKKETDVTISDYLNSVRIKNACALLRQGESNVTETALRCGYNSPVYFCRVFKEIVHQTPTAYRRQQLGV